MLELSEKWAKHLINKPETGMGYQVCSVHLADGRVFRQVVVDSGCISKIRDVEGIPFAEPDIVDIVVTHDKWTW